MYSLAEQMHWARKALVGDPFWVGRAGRAYVGGLRDGAGGRVAVVATHFPGMGNADRPAAEEVATVRKSLDQLRQTELTPFLAVAAALEGEAGRTVDGLLVSHIRYQGLQGNIRETTRPVSLDREALSQVVAIEPIAGWHLDGGLMVSIKQAQLEKVLKHPLEFVLPFEAGEVNRALNFGQLLYPYESRPSNLPQSRKDGIHHE